MFRIDSNGSVSVEPTASAEATGGGFFSDGNPGSGIKATIVSADWLNDVQESLLDVVEDVGVTPVKGTHTQLTTAVKSIITKYSAQQGPCANLGMSYSGGTFSVCAANQTALSATNYATIAMPKTTSGAIDLFTVTANATFIDDAGASEILGEYFGTTAGTAWSNTRPFFLYAVNTDDTNAGIRFAISPDPRKLITPSSSLLIGKKGTPATTASDSTLWFLDSGTVSSFTSKPCVLLGGFRMTKSSSDDWTVQSLDISLGDGIRQDPFKGSVFTFPTLQMGADSGHCISNGGTAPVFSNNLVAYELDTYGYCTVRYDIDGDGGTDGSGAVNMRVALPYKWNAGATSDSNTGVTPIRIGTPAGANIRFFEGATTDQSYFTVIDSATNNILWSAFTNGTRHIWGHIRYKVAF